MSANLYLDLHDDGPAVATTSPARRLAALAFAVLLLAALPMVLMADQAVAAPGSKVSQSSGDDEDDDDRKGNGDGDDTGTATESRSAANTGKTAVSAKDATATASATATNTGNTGVSTKNPTATASATATNTGKTGVSTKG